GRAKDARLELVEKSPLDDRNYQALTLRNGLRVLCCSDPNADRAAAALDVHVGYFSDPDEVPGLAHFCEHMLFLGTEDFPEENSFDAYLTANSGFSNAFTEAEDTCFFFSCGTDGFAGALQRFGAFFRAPLFTESATGREVNAINSEHQKNVPNDVYRLGQVLNSRANPQHPYHRFGTGNVKTLLEDTAAKG
ncbi:Insulin-degrading enzyme (Insulin protease) (Insulinase) (Insulysin), partial [Durusdinium trenchii]